MSKLPSVECMLISLKFRGYFVNLTFTKTGGCFAELPSIDCGLISPKFKGIFAKFTFPAVLPVESADPMVE